MHFQVLTAQKAFIILLKTYKGTKISIEEYVLHKGGIPVLLFLV